MCGMCGVVGPAAAPTRLGPAAIDALRHRGPEGEGTVAVDGAGMAATLGHTRLAIVDLSEGGAQPMANEDGTVWMSFNGEIYNAAELRRHCEAHGHTFRGRSDGEVIIHLWELEGWRGFERLNGIYAVAIADQRTGELVLTRDPIGVKPLVYATDGESLWFASELRALAAMGAPMGDLDLPALAAFLTFLWVPEPSTPHTGARSVLPGEVVRWSATEGLRRHIAIDLLAEAAAAPDLTLDEANDGIRQLVIDAVQRQLIADVPVALMASGGIDSSLIWWAAGSGVERAYTMDWSVAETAERLDEDTTTSAILAARLGTPLSLIEGADVELGALPPSGDLIADPAFGLSRLIARQAQRDGYKVLLSGQGGDEVFAGYRRHVLGPLAARHHLGPIGTAGAALLKQTRSRRLAVEYAARMLRGTSRADPLASYMELCTYSTARDRAIELDVTEAEVSDEVVWARHRDVFDKLPSDWSLLRRFRALDLAVYLPGLGLAYADRAGMEFGVEVRVPWLDLDLVRWALRLPDEALVRGRTGKHLTRQLAAEVLPSIVADRAKRGFALPVEHIVDQTGEAGERGFRQSAYLASAAQMLARYRASPLT